MSGREQQSASGPTLSKAMLLRKELLEEQLVGAPVPDSVAEAIMTQAEADLESLREALDSVPCDLI